MHQVTGKLLSNVEFTQQTLVFEGQQFEGFLEVTNEVRQTYFQNTIDNPRLREESCAAVEEWPNGIVMVNSEPLGSPLTGPVHLHLDSMDGDEVGGSVALSLDVTEESGERVVLAVRPGPLLVDPAFVGRGHRVDLISAACWLLQDVMVGLFEGYGPDTEVYFGVQTEGVPEVDEELRDALHKTLEVTGQALTPTEGDQPELDFQLTEPEAA